jgi:tetraacyldisaccharide 4'-kinase
LRGVERLWFSTDPMARTARAALLPLELAYGGITRLRGKLYDTGLLSTRAASIPVLSVGNLSVGGTGKTPLSAWLADELAARGGRPAIVLRGYGGDEQEVHRVLNPGIAVVASPDRAAGVERAAAQGCDVAVLDDAFQHRRAARTADIVLVSAESWTERRHLLPAGPWREPLAALRRASLVVVTRKSASLDRACSVAEAVTLGSGGIATAIVHLGLGELRVLRRGADDRESSAMSAVHLSGGGPAGKVGGEERRVEDSSDASFLRLASLSGTRVLAISAIGDPRAFVAQLAALGARVESRAFADHHRFTSSEVERLARTAAELARGDGSPAAVCTLKDAVKLAPLWPREALPLWYVSQQPEVEKGRAAVDALIVRALAVRHRQP